MNKAKREIVHEIALALDKAVIRNEDGTHSYRPGSSDETIADELHCDKSYVYYHRREVYGKKLIKTSLDETNLAAVMVMVEALVTNFDELITILASRGTLPNENLKIGSN